MPAASSCASSSARSRRRASLRARLAALASSPPSRSAVGALPAAAGSFTRFSLSFSFFFFFLPAASVDWPETTSARVLRSASASASRRFLFLPPPSTPPPAVLEEISPARASVTASSFRCRFFSRRAALRSPESMSGRGGELDGGSGARWLGDGCLDSLRVPGDNSLAFANFNPRQTLPRAPGYCPSTCAPPSRARRARPYLRRRV